MQYALFLIAGFVILILAGDLLVRGSVVLAERLGIPSIVIGLTVVAFGTSAPELVISIKSALTGHPDIAVGNVVGSNIANVLLVLGMPALIKAIPCGGAGSARNAVFMIIATAIFIGACWLQPIGIFHGILLLTLLVVFLADSVLFTRRQKAQGLEVEDPLDDGGEHSSNLPIAICMLVVGLIGLPIGAHLAVEEGAIQIARALHVSEAAIALTIVALGTSLPELATALVAARKGHTELAMGNVIGSNVFNVLAIIGTTAIITPLGTPERIHNFDLWIMAGTALFLLPFVFFCIPIRRRIGGMMILAYMTYLVSVFYLEM